MNLESSAQAIAENFPTGRIPDIERRERLLERFGQFAFGGFGIVLLLAILGLLYAILTKMVLAGQQPWIGVLLMAFIIFAALTLAYVVFAEDLKEKRKKAAANARPASRDLPPASTARLIEEKDFEPVPSAVEDTTELLPTRPRER